MKRFVCIKYLDSWNIWDNHKQEFRDRFLDYDTAVSVMHYLNENIYKELIVE